MNYKKVVYRSISSLTAFTAFLYCFKIPVFADDIYLLDDSRYLYENFYDLGFKQEVYSNSETISNTISFSGSINENGGFSITPSNFTGVESGQMSVQIGDSYGVANDIISGTIGSTSQQLICNPNPLNEYIGDDNVAYPKYSCYYYAQNYGTQQDINLTNIVLDGVLNGNRTTTYSGSFNGTNLDFTLNNLNGTVTGTISSAIKYKLPYLIKDNFNDQYLAWNQTYDQNFTTSEKGLNIVAWVHIDPCNISITDIKHLFYYGTRENYISTFMTGFTPAQQYKQGQEFNSIMYWSTNQTSTTQYIKVNKNYDFDTTGLKIIPLYIGGYSGMPDNIRNLMGKDSKLWTLLVRGTDIANTDKITMQNKNNNLNTGLTDISTLEDTYNNQLTNNFQLINTTNPLITNNGFINASTWLATQYTNIITPTPVNNMIMFSLVLGLAMVLIGKVRK